MPCVLRRFGILVVAALAVFLSSTMSAPRAETSAAQRDLLVAKAAADGSVRVIVQLQVAVTLEHLLSLEGILQQRSMIAAAQDALRQRLEGPGLIAFDPIEGMAATVVQVDSNTLPRLLADPGAFSMNEDRRHRPDLAQSSPLIKAPLLWTSGFNGNGQAVAVLDTGVDRNHAFFGGRVQEEMCFSTNTLLSGTTLFASSTLCPNGQTSQTGTGAAINCTPSLPGCDHGTHVAGIAVGFQSSTFSGVAPGARIIAAQVFSHFVRSQCGSGAASDCVLSYDSDQIRALQRVYALRSTYSIAAVNLSIGGDLYADQQACDNENVTYKAAIDALRAVGIATVIAAGNNGSANSISTPGCISSAIAVGSTEKNDTVSTFSNSTSFVRLLAPGGFIQSSVPGGGFGTYSGTSMATPHVAGAFALLRSARPAATADQIAGALAQSGPRISYARSSFTYSLPRIDVAAALAAIDGVAPIPEPGWWWNPSEPGRGFAIEVRNGNLFFASYLYDNTGRAIWDISSGPMSSGSTYSGILQAFANGQALFGGYRPPAFQGSPGTIMLQFTGTRTATMVWPGGSVALQRFPFGPHGLDSPRQPFQPESGWWWNAAESGSGYTIEIQGTQIFMAAFMYRSDGTAVWYLANGSMLNDRNFVGTLTEYAGGQSMTGTYRPAHADQTTGVMTLQFSTTEAAQLILPSGRIVPLTRYRF